MSATLVACSHGTNSAAGRDTITALVRQLATLLPGIRIEEAFVDVQEPGVDEVVATAALDGPVVVVPLLLSTGVHTRVDIARAVAPHPGIAVAAPALGPHDLLALVLESRLLEVGIDGDDAVVLAAAGSSDPAAALEVEQIAARLSLCLHAPVAVGYASATQPSIEEVIAEARGTGARRVIVASYLLAQGFFSDVIARAGADEVTAPLAPDLRIAALAAQRYRDAAAGVAASVPA